MHTITINENISLHYINMEKLKTTAVGVYLRRPLSKDENSKNAVLAKVLKSGSKKYPTQLDISKKLQDLYGAKLGAGVIKNGDNQVIFFDGESISDSYSPDGEKLTGELLELIMELIFEPRVRCKAFSKDILKTEKDAVINQIEAQINDKKSFANQRCVEQLCSGDAYALSKYGTKEQVEEITTKSLYEHYQDIITSSQIDIFVCGKVNIEELSDVVVGYTKKLTFKKAVYEPTKVIDVKTDKKEISDAMEVTQGKLSIGFTTGISAKDKEYASMMVANSIYGSGTHSKLFNNVREKLSLAYYAHSSFNKYKGIITVNAGIEFENFQKAYNEAISQLDELKNGNIGEDELNFSKISLANSLKSYQDDQRYMQLYSLDCLYLGIKPDLDALIESILAVTKESVIEVSQKINENVVYFLKGKNDN